MGGGTLDAQVEFHLGLGAGGTDAHPGVVFQLIVQHVGLRQVGGGDRSGGQVQDGVLQVVPDFEDLAGAHGLQGIGPQRLQDGGDLGGALLAGVGQVDGVLPVVTVLWYSSCIRSHRVLPWQ